MTPFFSLRWWFALRLYRLTRRRSERWQRRANRIVNRMILEAVPRKE